MGLEFEPYWAWEEEEAQARDVHKQQQRQQQHQQQCIGEVEKQPTIDEESIEEEVRDSPEEDLLGCLAAMNGEHREYAVLVAEEEEDDENEDQQSFFSIVLDYPQFLGQGETKESALRHASRLLHYAFGTMLVKGEVVPMPSDGDQVEAKKAAMERDWQLVKLENFSMELVPLQFQSGIDYTARPPKSDGEYESDHEDEELFELESRMSTP